MAIAPELAGHPVEVPLADERSTEALARVLASALRAGDVVFLIGDLGTGKTALARGLINALPPAEDGATEGEIPEQEVPSPTFTLVQIYERGALEVWHVDLYRLEGPEEVADLGLEEAAEAITLIEWPERLGDRLPPDRLEVRLDYGSEIGSRRAEITGRGAWRDRLAALDFSAVQRART